MRRIGFLLGLSLLTPALIVIPTAPAAAEEGTVDSAYVKVALTRDGQTFQHPGFRVAKDEQGLFVIEADGRSHEVSILLRETSTERFSITVEYAVDGRNLLRDELVVEAGKIKQLSKGATTLAINVDPQGKKDTTRKDDDKLDGPGSDDPLGGM